MESNLECAESLPSLFFIKLVDWPDKKENHLLVELSSVKAISRKKGGQKVGETCW